MSQPPVCPPGTHLVTKHTCVPDVVPCPDLPADGRAQPLKMQIKMQIPGKSYLCETIPHYSKL